MQKRSMIYAKFVCPMDFVNIFGSKQLQVIRITFCEKGQLQKKGRGFPSKDIMENALKIGFGNGKEHFVWECHGDVFVDFFAWF